MDADTETPIETLRLLSMADVKQLTSLSASSVHRKVAAGEFPRPLQVGQRRVAWREAEVREWLAALEPTA